MSIIILIICVFLLLAVVWAAAESQEVGIGFTSFCFAAMLCGWLVVAGFQKPVVKDSYYLPVSTITSDRGNIKVVVRGTEVINLNEKFKVQIPEGAKVKCVNYKAGPYLFLYFDEWYDLELGK